LGALTEKYEGISFVIGNGHCRHIHVLHDFKSLFRPVKLATSTQRNEKLPDVSGPTKDQAIDLMQSGNYQAALVYFNVLLAKESSDWTLFYMAGQCARFSNDIPMALRHLKRAAQLEKNDSSLLFALGVAHQLSGQLHESEDALRNALELDADMDSAYNSLGITQMKMGHLDLATHNLEEGLKALSRRIARTMRNQRETTILPHPNVLGTRWTQVAINGAAYLCAKEPDISRLAWLTGEQAIHENRTKTHAGLFWKESVDANGGKTRILLPNFFNTFCASLHQDGIYRNILESLGSALDLKGEHSEAKLCFTEAKEFY
jgi:tetratricopeptide (TPR) repeat protein